MKLFNFERRKNKVEPDMTVGGGAERVRGVERIHRDFIYKEDGWHENELFKNAVLDGTLPGLSWDFRLTDEQITDFFEDFPYPTKIKRDGELYVVTTFVNEKNSLSVGEHLTHNRAEIISEPNIPKRRNEAA